MAAESNSQTQRPSSWKGISAVFAIVVALLVAVALLLVFTIDLGRFKQPLESIVSDVLGREFRADGSLSIRVGRTIDVSASDVFLASADWDDEPAMLAAKRVTATIRTASLLSGPLRIENIESEDVRLRVAISDSGAVNWAFGDGRKTGQESAERHRAELPVIIGRVDVRRAEVTVRNPEQALEIKLDAIEHAHQAGDDRLLTQMTGTVNDVPLSFEGGIGPRAHLRRGGEISFAYSGSLGEIDFSTEGSADDLLAPAEPTVRLELRGPNIEYLFDILEVRRFTAGPLDVALGLARADDRIELDLEGQLGQFSVAADGHASDLRTLEQARLSVAAAGPNIDHVGRLFGVDRLPEAPFSIDGCLGKSGEKLTFEDIELEVGESRFELGGHLRGFPRSESADVALNVRGSDIAEFRELLAIPGVLSGPFDLTARLQAPVDSGERIEVDGRINGISLDVDLFPSRKTDFVGSSATFEVVVPEFSTIGDAAGLDGFPALPFMVSGSAEYRGDRVSLRDVSATLAESNASATGIVDLDFPGSLTNLKVRLGTPNLADLLDAFGVDGAPPTRVDYRSQLSVRNDTLFLSGIDSQIGRGAVGGSAIVALRPLASRVDFNLEARDIRLADLVEASDAFRPADLALRARVDGGYAGDRLTFHRSIIEVGDARVEVNGQVDLPPNLTATALTLFADIPNVAALGSSDSFMLPQAPLTVTARFAGQGDTLSARDVRMRIGDNVIETDLSYTAADRPTIDLRVAAPVLDLRPLIPQPTVETAPAARREKRDRVIPDVAFPVESLDAADADIEIDIGSMIFHRIAYRDVRLEASLGDSALRVKQFEVHGRRGRTYGAIAYVPDADGWSFDAGFRVDGLVLASLEESDEIFRARPAFNLDADLSGRGDNLRDLLATLDGRVLMHSGAGVLPAGSGRFARLLFGDFATELLQAVNPLAKSSSKTSIRCAVVMLNMEDGMVSGDPALVMQTDMLNIFAKGKVNLANEALDFDINTQQRKGIGLSLGDLIHPYTKVGGTLASPVMAFDETGAIVEGGAAFATGGLTVIAKALRNRFLSDPDPCGTALEAYRKAVATSED